MRHSDSRQRTERLAAQAEPVPETAPDLRMTLLIDECVPHFGRGGSVLTRQPTLTEASRALALVRCTPRSFGDGTRFASRGACVPFVHFLSRPH